MAERPSWATSVGGGQISVEDARVAIGGAFLNGGANATDARSGWLPAPSTVSPGQVTANGTPNNSVNIAPFMRIQQSVRGKGPYIMCLDTSKSINILSTPADPTNPRRDLIIAQQSDAFYGDANSLMSVRQVVGTPAGSPVDPTVTGSTDFVLLARVRVAANMTTVAPGVIDDLRPTTFSIASGGILNVANATERNALANPWVGMTVYRIDGLWHEFWTGSGWRIIEMPVLNAFSDLATFITSPYEGQIAYILNDRGLYRRRSGVWTFFMFAESGGGYARYVHSTLAAVATGTDTKIPFQTPIDTAAQVTPSGTGNTDFTLNLAGIWNITCSARLVANASANERALCLAKSSATGTIRYAESSMAVANASANLTVTTNRRFAAGDSVCAVLFQSTGGPVNTDPSFSEAMHISFNWEGN